MSRSMVLLVLMGLAYPPAAEARDGHPLQRTDPLFLGVEAGMSAALFGATYLIPAPDACRWCGTNPFDRGLRSAFLASSPRIAGLASDVMAFGITTATGLTGVMVPAFLGHRKWDALENVIIAMDATLVTLAINRGVKVSVARRRPAFVYGDGDGMPASEENVSFFSGHTALAFSVAASTTTVAFLRGYKIAPYLAAGTGGMALTAGILRISADAHWGSDVLVGMCVGTAIGVLAPLLLHARKGAVAQDSVSVAPMIGSDASCIMLTWPL